MKWDGIQQLRIVTKAGREETLKVSAPPTHICAYEPAPGGSVGRAVGYMIKVCADVFGTRVACGSVKMNGEKKEEGRE